MKIPKVIQDLKRRKIRYILFRTKWEELEGTDPVLPEEVDLTIGQIKAIRRHFITNEFPIEGFETEWDIGIDDIDTMVNRKGKYWLFGIDKFVHVHRPKKRFLVPYPEVVDEESGEVIKRAGVKEEIREFVDSENDGIAFMRQHGFAKELSENRWDYDYQKILEGCPDRTTWVPETVH